MTTTMTNNYEIRDVEVSLEHFQKGNRGGAMGCPIYHAFTDIHPWAKTSNEKAPNLYVTHSHLMFKSKVAVDNPLWVPHISIESSFDWGKRSSPINYIYRFPIDRYVQDVIRGFDLYDKYCPVIIGYDVNERTFIIKEYSL